jgi:FdhD protein
MMPRRSTLKTPITKVLPGSVIAQQDTLTVEEPLEIRLNYECGGPRADKSISVTMRTPGDDFELAAGFLYSEGIVQDGAQIHEISYCMGSAKLQQRYNIVSVRLRAGVAVDLERLERHFQTHSSCGVCGKTSLAALQTHSGAKKPPQGPLINADVVKRLPELMRQKQSSFEKTGGLHAAALLDASGRLLCLREDVGRHNALDKLIGDRLLHHRLPLHDCILAVSGRTSFEIMQKAIMAGLPIVASVGAPSSLALELAREFGITLLGFVREDRFNIYHDTGRIRL